ncbi:hypothetical protein CPB83DRAFT_886058 [Crepidotus variabilis]|uniref:F-box domain-containing protein n=1 Tax=Crepidotus variabilis TaxID=179855 RepID=A0A9P6E9J4_9AGAR|nr:hypothetical protein CPB83DRAFT_886058 [Crepidotus variabilis]
MGKRFKVHRLPNELYDQIVSLCGQKELYTLTLTDRHLCCIATPYLYRSIQRLNSLNKTTKLLTSLLYYDHTSPLVNTFGINLVWFSASLLHQVSRTSIFFSARKVGTRKTFGSWDALQNYLTLLSAVLQKLVNLKHLQLIFEHEESHDENCARLLAGAKFQLRSLSSSFLLGPSLCHFINSQTQLEELHLSNHIPYLTPSLRNDSKILPLSSLSRIRTIGWSIKTPMQLVRFLASCTLPQTVVIDLTAAIYYDNLNIEDYLRVGPPSQTVERAKIDFGSLMKQECVASTLAHFPALKYLNIIFYTVTFSHVATVLQNSSKSIEHLVITGYFSEIKNDLKLTLQPLVDSAFKTWENLNLIEVAVKYNKAIWHCCFERQVVQSQESKATINPYVYLSFV